MASICLEAEMAVFYKQFREELKSLTPKPLSVTEACCIAAVDASVSSGAKAIICLSISGATAKLCSKWRPLCPILSVTRSDFVARVVSCRVAAIFPDFHGLLLLRFHIFPRCGV